MVEQGGVHPDEAVIAHGAAVHQRAVAHGDVPAQQHFPARVAVEDGIVLDVGVLANRQGTAVAPEHSPVPDRRARLEEHVALHGGVVRHKGRSLVPGAFSTKG